MIYCWRLMDYMRRYIKPVQNRLRIFLTGKIFNYRDNGCAKSESNVMSAQKKRKASKGKRLFTILFFAAFVLIGFELSFYSGVLLFNAQAQENLQGVNVIKIPPPIDVVHSTNPQYQSLQKSDIKIVTSDEKTLVFRVELARTKEQRQKGLMFRDAIKPGSGMLFLFEDLAERSFWMKNTWISLDIIFIQEDGVIHKIHKEAKPHSLEHINSEGEVRYVLEIGGREADRLGIKTGDKVLFD